MYSSHVWWVPHEISARHWTWSALMAASIAPRAHPFAADALWPSERSSEYLKTGQASQPVPVVDCSMTYVLPFCFV